jgi:hypothetical protein
MEVDVEIAHRRNSEEARWITVALQSSFTNGIIDQRAWIRNIEHLCRRADELANRVKYGTESEWLLPLITERDRARTHARSWAETARVRGWTVEGRSLPAPRGSCPRCASWVASSIFCPECGTKMAAG